MGNYGVYEYFCPGSVYTISIYIYSIYIYIYRVFQRLYHENNLKLLGKYFTNHLPLLRCCLTPSDICVTTKWTS